MIKTVRECDYCNEQTTVDSMTRPTMPEGWRIISITVNNHVGDLKEDYHYEICERHETLSIATIVATVMG